MRQEMWPKTRDLTWVYEDELTRLRTIEAAARATGWNETDGLCWCPQSRETTGALEHTPRCSALRAALQAADSTEAGPPDVLEGGAG